MTSTPPSLPDMDRIFRALSPFTETQRAALLPEPLEFAFMGTDFDEPPARITARDRLEPMLRYLRMGDGEAALRAMEGLCRQNPDRLFYLLEYGVQLASSGKVDEAMSVFRKILKKNPQHFQAIKYSAMLKFVQGAAGEALELYAKALALQPGDFFANLNSAMARTLLAPKSRPKPQSMPRSAICTSLPPCNFEMSQMAVRSWLERGFAVYSVNTQAEIDILRPYFDDVVFYPCERTGREKFGKDFQYLDTVMHCLAQSGAEVCGIVNADIVMRGEHEDWAQIAQSGRTAFTYGSRVNVRNFEDNHGWVYEAGADFFFFPPSFTAQTPESEYALGLPWWDCFLPCWAMASGLPMVYVYSPVAVHKYHVMNWNFDLYYDFGFYTIRRFFAPLLGSLVAANPGRNLFMRRLVSAVSFAAKRTSRGAAPGMHQSYHGSSPCAHRSRPVAPLGIRHLGRLLGGRAALTQAFLFRLGGLLGRRAMPLLGGRLPCTSGRTGRCLHPCL